MIRAAKNPIMDWDGIGMLEAPTAPESLKEAGLTTGFVGDMILKTLYTYGGMLGLDLSKVLCLPFRIIEEPLISTFDPPVPVTLIRTSAAVRPPDKTMLLDPDNEN